MIYSQKILQGSLAADEPVAGFETTGYMGDAPVDNNSAQGNYRDKPKGTDLQRLIGTGQQDKQPKQEEANSNDPGNFLHAHK